MDIQTKLIENYNHVTLTNDDGETFEFKVKVNTESYYNVQAEALQIASDSEDSSYTDEELKELTPEERKKNIDSGIESINKMKDLGLKIRKLIKQKTCQDLIKFYKDSEEEIAVPELMRMISPAKEDELPKNSE